MTLDDIVAYRLYNQQLSHHTDLHVEDVVARLGAIQAQDYTAAKWGIGLRLPHATNALVEKTYNEGKILRTHIMRPTWHFVMPEDIRWMTALTAPRVKKLLAHYNRKLALDDALFAKTNKIIVDALQGHQYLTRQELRELLTTQGIITDVQRLGHIIMWAELDGIICSGPRREKQFTYALLDERVSQYKKIDHEESLAKLAQKYFFSHGPAQLKDFSWWSGLTMKDAQTGVDAIASQLSNETIDGNTYWFYPSTSYREKNIPQALLVSIYDEYTIAYRDRSALGGEKYIETLLSKGNALTAVLLIAGKITGTWKKLSKKDNIIITVHPLRNLSSQEKNAVFEHADRYGRFFNSKVSVEIL